MILSLHSGCPGTTANQLACDDNSGAGANAQLSYDMSFGETVLIRVSHVTGQINNALTSLRLNFTRSDDCEDARPLLNGESLDVNLTGTTADGSTLCGATTGDIWYRFTTECAGDLVVDTIGSGVGTMLNLYTGCPGTDANEIACDKDDALPIETEVRYNLPPNEEVIIRLAQQGELTGLARLNLQLLQPNIACSAATVVPLGDTVFGCTDNVPGLSAPTCDLIPNSLGLWYVVEGTGGQVTASTDHPATDFGAQVRVYTGTCGALTCVGTSGLGSRTWNSQPETAYFVHISGTSFTSSGNFALTYSGEICLCEFDGDAAQVDVSDLLAYLAAWFALDASADFNDDGTNINDLLLFLSCWFDASNSGSCP